MMDKEAHKLTEAQELLLSRYFDGELSFFSAFRARRLITSNPAASTFLTTLETVSAHARSSERSHGESCDLWDRISARIDAEEKAAIYLGKRTAVVEHAHEGFFARMLSSHALLGGLSGAAVAAAVLLTVAPSSTPKNIAIINADAPTLARAPEGFHAVTLPSAAGAASTAENRPLSRALTPMEMDWMRGSGPVKIIQNPGSSSGIIWIKRQRMALTSKSHAPSSQKNAARKKGLDETALSQSE